MDLLLIFAKGLGVGLAIAAPVGPIGLLCIQRTLHQGVVIGLVSGLGAACADAVYGGIAGFGLTSVSDLLIDLQEELRVVGGAFLLILGARIALRKRPAEVPAAAAGQAPMAGAFGSCFVLTLTNPTTILSFVAVFAGLGLVGDAATYGAAVSLVIGVFLGSAAWWLTLSTSVGLLLRRRMTATSLRWINWISGTAIAGFGVAALAVAAF